MYLRFVVGTDADNPYLLDGVFRAAIDLRDYGEIEGHEVDRIAEVLTWFNEHLPGPPFDRIFADRHLFGRPVCWFKADRSEPLRRMWEMVGQLREHGRPVRFIKTERPGRVMYEDEFQIVAETPNTRERDWRLVPRRCRTTRRRRTARYANGKAAKLKPSRLCGFDSHSCHLPGCAPHGGL